MLKYHYPYPLLPSLTRLDWGDHELAQYLPVFTQKTLVEFSCSPVSEEELRLALHCIETSMPQLQKLTVKSDKLFAHFEMDEITHAISSLDHLTSLSFTYPPLPPDALVHLSRTAHLAEATLDLYQNNEDAHLSPAWGGFAALTKLTLGFARNIENYPCATTFLPRLAGVNLTKLSIVIRPTAHADEFNQLMSAVGHLTHLQECEICFDVIRVWGDLVLDGAALAPLYNLVNMRDFQVTWVPLTFSPQAVSDLTNAWRRLENLLLYAPAQSDYHLRLDSLAFFAENCPALHALTLRVAPVERDWRCAPDMGESASNLASLELQNSIIDPHAEDQVAEYLAKVFPIAAVGHKFWKARPDRAAAVMQRIHEREKGLVPQGRAGIEDKGRSEDGESE
ncbi:hypothetical protein PsYK624_164020 [Phanerochaete sordida]|uniref:F-box domain-containing protein n=1 Tax=Phanerochaete sordida TaxID=48140 RepID=A0A9P3LNF9_9APHY|nr:hypothetical protein PsYK624_164020 [Phanerochaete sordida]